jgi:hypothetical protein
MLYRAKTRIPASRLLLREVATREVGSSEADRREEDRNNVGDEAVHNKEAATSVVGEVAVLHERATHQAIWAVPDDKVASHRLLRTRISGCISCNSYGNRTFYRRVFSSSPRNDARRMRMRSATRTSAQPRRRATFI